MDAWLAALGLYARHYVPWMKKYGAARLERMVKEGRFGAEAFSVFAEQRFSERAGDCVSHWLVRLRRALDVPARSARTFGAQTALALADLEPLFNVTPSRRTSYVGALKEPVAGDLTDLALRNARAANSAPDRVERRGDFQRMDGDIRRVTRQVGSDEPLAPLVELLRVWRQTARTTAGR